MDVVRVACCAFLVLSLASGSTPRTYRYIRLYRVPSSIRPVRQIYYPSQDRRQTLEGLEAENNAHGGYGESYSEPDTTESSAGSDDSGPDEPLAHVDYGAHTGHGGAFGWYADFPVVY